MIDNKQQQSGAESLADLDVDVLKRIVNNFERIVHEKNRKTFSAER